MILMEFDGIRQSLISAFALIPFATGLWAGSKHISYSDFVWNTNYLSYYIQTPQRGEIFIAPAIYAGVSLSKSKHGKRYGMIKTGVSFLPENYNDGLKRGSKLAY